MQELYRFRYCKTGRASDNKWQFWWSDFYLWWQKFPTADHGLQRQFLQFSKVMGMRLRLNNNTIKHDFSLHYICWISWGCWKPHLWLWMMKTRVWDLYLPCDCKTRKGLTLPYLLVLFSHHWFSSAVEHDLNIALLGGCGISLSEITCIQLLTFT